MVTCSDVANEKLNKLGPAIYKNIPVQCEEVLNRVHYRLLGSGILICFFKNRFEKFTDFEKKKKKPKTPKQNNYTLILQISLFHRFCEIPFFSSANVLYALLAKSIREMEFIFLSITCYRPVIYLFYHPPKF